MGENRKMNNTGTVTWGKFPLPQCGMMCCALDNFIMMQPSPCTNSYALSKLGHVRELWAYEWPCVGSHRGNTLPACDGIICTRPRKFHFIKDSVEFCTERIHVQWKCSAGRHMKFSSRGTVSWIGSLNGSTQFRPIKQLDHNFLPVTQRDSFVSWVL